MSEAADKRVATRRLELAATVLLALATVATAWSGYQASRWNGEQAKAFSRATSLRIESAKADDLANAQTQVDVASFMQWVDATAQGDAQLAAFYERRFRAELKPAFDAWLATKPLRNSRAPLTPFTLPQYTVAERAKAEQLEAQAEAWAAKARTDVQRATNYVLAVVLFAAALFFAGICTKLETPRLRRFLLGFGVAVLVATLVWIATFPVSLSI